MDPYLKSTFVKALPDSNHTKESQDDPQVPEVSPTTVSTERRRTLPGTFPKGCLSYLNSHESLSVVTTAAAGHTVPRVLG
jgi:hypothetical protein